MMQTAEIVALIDSLPAWVDLPEGDPRRDAAMGVLRQLDRYQTADIRAAVVEYFGSAFRSQEGYSVAKMSKLHLVIRYVFDGPEAAPKGTRSYGGWVGLPQGASSVNLLWPLSKDGKGNFQLTGVSKGYVGAPYMAVADFDRCQKEFRRHPSGASTQPTTKNGEGQ